MVARALNQSYRNFSKGLDNVNDPEILKPGFTPACRNVRFDTTGVTKRGGTKKMITTAVDTEIVSIFDFTDRRGNSLALFIEADATVWKYNALDNKADISALIVLSAAYSYQHGSFWKGAVDYLMLTDFTNYVKKISYTDTPSTYDVRNLDVVGGVLYAGTTGNSTTGVKSYNGFFSTVGATLGVGVSCLHVVSATSMLAGCVDGHVWSLSGTTWTDRGQPNTTYIPKCCRIIGSNFYVGYNTTSHGGLYIAPGNSTWTLDSVKYSSDYFVNDIYHVSETEIYICGVYSHGAGELDAYLNKKTVNGTGNDTVLFYDDTTAYYFEKMSYLDATHLYISGYLFSTTFQNNLWNWNGSALSSIGNINPYVGSPCYCYALSSSYIYVLLNGSLRYSTGSGSIIELVSAPSGIVFKSIKAVSQSEVYIGTDVGGIYLWNGVTLSTLTAATLATLNLGDRLPTESTVKTMTVTGAGTTTVTVTSTTGLYPGCFLSHADITAFTYIVSITNSTDMVVSTTVTAGAKTSTAIIYAPRAKYIETYNNMVFLGYLNYQGADRTTEVAVSEVGDIDDWRDVDATDAGLAGYRIFQFDTGQNTYISGMKSINSVLAVFTTKSVWAINGYAPTSDAMSVRRLAEVGCIAPESVQRVSTSTGDILVWLSAEGFFATDGSSVFPVSRQLEYAFASALVSNARAVYDKENREYRCAVPSTAASTGNDVTLVLNLDTMGWSESVYSQNITAIGKYGEQIFIAGADKILREESEDYATDDITVAGVAGTAITMYYDLPINPDRQMIEYELRKLYAQYDGTGTCTLEVYKDGVLQKTISAVAQDTLQRTSVKGKNFVVRITYAANDLTFALYAIECSLKILKER